VTAQGVRRRLIELPRIVKQLILVLLDGLLIAGALLSASWLNAIPGVAASTIGLWQFAVAVIVAIPLLGLSGVYRTVTRFPGSQMLLTAAAVLTVTVGAMGLVYAVGSTPAAALTTSAAVSFFSLALLGIVGSRLLMRYLLIPDLKRTKRRKDAVVVYGAGTAGARLLAALHESGRFRPVAVVDDNPELHGRLLSGVRVWPPSELRRLTRSHGVTRLLLAMPSISRRRRQAIIDQLMDLNVRIQTVPDIGDIIAGTASVDDLREVDVLDLLGRDPVPPDPALLEACVAGKVVLVTGAGGSIGSELCRQIIQLKPQKLIILDIAEFSLYRIDRELQRSIAARELDVELITLLGSVHHRPRMFNVMRAYGVQTVYHAAAYKHVPIVEQNMLEGVHNNIIGTWYAAEAAEQAGVEAFVLVSTDKAVSPTSVMGATKRAAELTLQGMTRRATRTRFCMVRFGNVLDSSGSVVPLFREQILRGGPVTVTDREVTRYFMTIPEAAQLVIQAGAMGRGGDVFVLDMGDPVKIHDLARRLIHLMGRTIRDEENPHGDIAIEFTGLRPGEKLYEELLIGGDVMETGHPKIRRAMEEYLEWPATHEFLQELLRAADQMDCERAIRVLGNVVHGYQTEPENVHDLTWSIARNLRAEERVPLGLVTTEPQPLPRQDDDSAAPPGNNAGARTGL
jgi:FlaA1/EpsC-like NDP-sugar epimerase